MARGPGKFEGVPEDIPAEDLYEQVLDGGTVDEIGSVDELGWYGLVERDGRWYIVEEDNYGFFDAEEFGSESEARARWREIEKAYEEFDSGEDDAEFAAGGIARHARHRARTRRRMQAGGLVSSESVVGGGIVEGPTEAVVGEAGPEAVTPIEPDKAEAMAERMAEAAETAAEDAAVTADPAIAGRDPEVMRVLESLADFAESEAEEAEEAAEEAEEAAEEGETAEAAAAATEAAAHAEAAISAEEAAEEIAPRRRGFARLMWGE
jgi:hypothetical protein